MGASVDEFQAGRTTAIAASSRAPTTSPNGPHLGEPTAGLNGRDAGQPRRLVRRSRPEHRQRAGRDRECGRGEGHDGARGGEGDGHARERAERRRGEAFRPDRTQAHDEEEQGGSGDAGQEEPGVGAGREPHITHGRALPVADEQRDCECGGQPDEARHARRRIRRAGHQPQAARGGAHRHECNQRHRRGPRRWCRSVRGEGLVRA